MISWPRVRTDVPAYREEWAEIRAICARLGITLEPESRDGSLVQGVSFFRFLEQLDRRTRQMGPDTEQRLWEHGEPEMIEDAV